MLRTGRLSSTSEATDSELRGSCRGIAEAAPMEDRRVCGDLMRVRLLSAASHHQRAAGGAEHIS